MAPRFAFVPARWLAPDSGLTPTDRLTLCVLCQWVNRESGECFPSVATIAAHAALSENSVRSAIKRLVVLGAVQVERRKDSHGDSASNLYTIIGYDPPLGKGARGTATVEVPVLQPLQDGTSTDGFEVPQPLKPNVVTETNDVPARAAGDPDGPPRTRVTAGPMTLLRQPMPELPDAEPMTEIERRDWRLALSKVGAGPRAVA